MRPHLPCVPGYSASSEDLVAEVLRNVQKVPTQEAEKCPWGGPDIVDSPNRGNAEGSHMRTKPLSGAVLSATASNPLYLTLVVPSLPVMKTIQSLLIATIFAFDPTVLAECNKNGMTGEYDVNNNTPVDLRIVCAQLSGSYVKNEFRRICIMDTKGRKWDFELSYIGNGDQRDIDIEECYSGMKAEAGCERGGRRKYWNWEYSFLTMKTFQGGSKRRAMCEYAPVDGSGQTGWVVEWSTVNNQITPKAYSTTGYEFEFDSQYEHQEM
ncbi:hypothetical protein CTAM01_11494 [Colletotrichum tamarilloi]|uniref:AA1-like domain-containing protein n=1 Tax=Colletotrichum tamarilloi TaxID=1209934 RepID=A0ABQ9QXI5_9PEZI|nr:uncharacterized protein CTAM01_11494 [Colletotrichum tamarilloi]KAK1488122.1 hypothetical protein CTAM01_11494 [Colletotrichum tamarilloi]